ncbi:MAG: hypothetical protein EB067_06655 [Actinobacteria bacterium]|nr:hypothetical protein [Actinomycetota bacterium]
MNFIKIKILRIVLWVFNKERGSIINQWGSTISPRELRYIRSTVLAERMQKFKESIEPRILNVEELKRYGSIADGGYVVPVNAINNSKFLISGGIETNNEFEIELGNLGILGIQVDNSIDTPPKDHKNLTFKRATLGGKDGVLIDDLLKSFDLTSQGVLKLDIEGSEYETLSEVESFQRFTTIILELHNLHKIVDDHFWDVFKSILDKFAQNHSVVFLAPNNCCGFSIIGGVPIPNVVEVTWARNDLIGGKKFSKIAALHPEQLKTNYENRAQLDISNIFPSNTL